MRVDAFDFDLPKELIADRPVTPRDAARLLDVTADGCLDRGRPRPACPVAAGRRDGVQRHPASFPPGCLDSAAHASPVACRHRWK